MDLSIPVSVGELIDKITILTIKSERLKGAGLDNVRKELALLRGIMDAYVPKSPELSELLASLRAVNATLWDIEEGKRACERSKTFDAAFIALARSVYIENDKRAGIKRAINALTRSDIVEVKSYDAY